MRAALQHVIGVVRGVREPRVHRLPGIPDEEEILHVLERDAERVGRRAGTPVPAEEGGAVAGNEARGTHVVRGNVFVGGQEPAGGDGGLAGGQGQHTV